LSPRFAPPDSTYCRYWRRSFTPSAGSVRVHVLRGEGETKVDPVLRSGHGDVEAALTAFRRSGEEIGRTDVLAVAD